MLCRVVLWLLLAGLVWVPTGVALGQQQREAVDSVAAVIESQIITKRELERKAASHLQALTEPHGSEAWQTRRLEILHQVLDIEISDRLVNRQLEIHADKVTATEGDVDRAIDNVAKMNNLSREQLQAALYGQGMTWSEYRQRLRSEIQRSKLLQFKVRSRVQINETDAQRRCVQAQDEGEAAQVCAAHILAKVPEGSSPQEAGGIQARLSRWQAALMAGADFASYALQYSDDKTAPDGSLGCFRPQDMLDWFRVAVEPLAVGEVSAVVRSPMGFHILKVTERRLPAKASCDGDALDPFRDLLFQEEMERQMQLWLAELRRKAFVEVRLPPLPGGKRAGLSKLH